MQDGLGIGLGTQGVLELQQKLGVVSVVEYLAAHFCQ